MSYIVAVAAFGLWAVLTRKFRGPLASKAWFVRPGLLLIGSASIANTTAGVWVAHALGGALGWVAGFVGVSATLAAGVVGLILLAATVLDLHDKQADGVAKTGLVALPILALVAAGPLAAHGAGLFDAIASIGTSGLTTMVGG